MLFIYCHRFSGSSRFRAHGKGGSYHIGITVIKLVLTEFEYCAPFASIHTYLGEIQGSNPCVSIFFCSSSVASGERRH